MRLYVRSDANMDGMGDGAFHTERTARAQRRRMRGVKKALVAVIGLSAVLGGGSYGLLTWRDARDQITTDLGAIGPAVRVTASARTHPRRSRTPHAPVQLGPLPPTKSAVRQDYLPSPTPSLSDSPEPNPSSADSPTDDQIAAMQVAQLLARPQAARSGMVAADSASVSNEVTADGSVVRVVTARHDLSGQGESLWAPDAGQRGATSHNAAVHCTQNFPLGVRAGVELRAGMLLCWRTSATKSVVTVATATAGRPSAASSAAVINWHWSTFP